MTSIDEKVPRAVRNEMFYFIARACSILVMTIGVPVTGFMLSRAVASADELAKLVSLQSVQIQLLSSEVRIRLDNDNKTISDHELRLRSMERK